MAGEDNLLSRITTLVSGFDDASWEALASIGLLRRARKDIEKGLQIKVVSVDTDGVKIDVPPFLVSIPMSGPAGASCSCPAPGICQHVIAAGIYLQNQSEGSGPVESGPTEESIRPEITLLTPEKVKSLVGATDYKKGVTLFERNTWPPTVEYGETVVVRLLPSAIEVRFVPGGGLDGMIAPKAFGKRAVVAGLLALRKHLGLEVPVSVAQQSLVDLSGTPRTKKQILDSACAVLEDAVALGLAHTSEVLADRLVTLAVSAQGGHMPRVSLALKTVADEVNSILRREARASEARLLLLISRVYALMDAIRSGGDDQSAELSGAFRGQYVEVPEIELSGVGAYPWQTGSGYVGLTVLFWSAPTKEFLSWSYARPEIQRSDARQRFFGEGPWEGTQSPKQVAAANLKLRNARRTAKGRLSASTTTSGLVLSTVAPATLDFGERLFTTWYALNAYVNTKQQIGLRDPNPLDLIAVLQPQGFGARSFDSIAQTFSWEIYDALSQPLVLTLPFREWTKESISILEQLSPAKDANWRFVVRVIPGDESFLVEPISILREGETESPVFQLAFDTLSPPTGGSLDERAISSNDGADYPTDEDGSDELFEGALPVRGAFSGLITELNRRLEAIAETGIKSGLKAHSDWFAKTHSEVHGFGLTTLAKILEGLSQQSVLPATIIKARYLSNLHSQAAAQLR
jgi:hypothetical protein